jgi:hypothetical protein
MGGFYLFVHLFFFTWYNVFLLFPQTLNSTLGLTPKLGY